MNLISKLEYVRETDDVDDTNSYKMYDTATTRFGCSFGDSNAHVL